MDLPLELLNLGAARALADPAVLLRVELALPGRRARGARGGELGLPLRTKLNEVEASFNALIRTTCAALGVPLGWMRSDVNARWHVNWRKYGTPAFEVPPRDEGGGATRVGALHWVQRWAQRWVKRSAWRWAWLSAQP